MVNDIYRGDLSLEAAVAVGVSCLIESKPALRKLISELIKNGPTVVFGGTVRDLLHCRVHNCKALPPRDIDLVVDDTSCIREWPHELTSFGGYRIHVDNSFTADIWSIDATIGFQRGCAETSYSNLVFTTVYSVNGCIFDIQSQKLEADVALRAIKSRCISFNCTKYFHSDAAFHAFRVLEIADRLGYLLDQDVASFVRQTESCLSVEEWYSAVHPHRRVLTCQAFERLIARSIDRLC